MTNRQRRICKNILRYKNLNKVLEKSKISDYMEIQEIMGPGALDFSDYNMDENTEIFLEDAYIEEVERHHSRMIDVWFTRIMALAALVISIFAMLGQLGILKLQPH